MDTNGNEEEEEAEDKPTYIAGTISILHDKESLHRLLLQTYNVV